MPWCCHNRASTVLQTCSNRALDVLRAPTVQPCSNRVAALNRPSVAAAVLQTARSHSARGPRVGLREGAFASFCGSGQSMQPRRCAAF
eukprot:9627001-Lingulodinium_polyedra.AAC.1